MPPELVIRSRRVATTDGIVPATIRVSGEKILSVDSYEQSPGDSPVHDVDNLVVMPGLVDTHVHINEPGRTDWEGFDTATRSAAAGGITTLVEMPLNSIPSTTTVDAYRAKLAAADGKCWVDTGFWGGVVPGNTQQLQGLYREGAFGFKCFLVPSGVPEFQHVQETHLREALPVLRDLGAPLLAHSELPAPIFQAEPGIQGMSPRLHSTWLASRPRAAENAAIDLLLRLCREFGTRTHIVHLSSSDALPSLQAAKAEGLPVTVETCPHYLSFSAEEIPEGATEFKCAPPIREQENRERLWNALTDGLIDFVATDHSPSPPAMKCQESGDFLQAWGGISSLQLSLPIAWTQARRRSLDLSWLPGWLCHNPATLAGLNKRKGAIAPGYDADLVVWDPEMSFRVEAAKLHHRHKLTPYAGCTLHGVVQETYLRGAIIYERGAFHGGAKGAILRRPL